MNAMYGPNRMRSTIEPEISAAVMIAKVAWYPMKTTCGIVPCASSPTPRSSTLANEPIQASTPGDAVQFENASE